MISISDDLNIDENELEWKFIRASGPGGQRVNKASTAVQLRFSLESLPEEVRRRLIQANPNRVTDAGELLVEASQHRSQQRNREQALERLIELVRAATVEPKRRRATRPTRASEERRLKEKRQRGDLKRSRKPPELDE